MNITQRTLDFTTRPKLRLSEVERLIRLKRIIMLLPRRSFCKLAHIKLHTA